MIMNLKTKKAIEQLEQFVSIPLEETLRQHEKTTHQEIATNLFKNVASTVPAYQSFLATHNIKRETIQTLADFQKLPVICKENYISVYSLPELCKDGILGGCDTIAASSGSTGKPTFWPRFFTDELQIATRFEQIFHDSFGANIYPENVSVGLEQPIIREWVTGKFVLQVKEDQDQNRFLSVVVELAPGLEGSEEKIIEITNSILAQLLRLNSEFANYVPGEYQRPQVELKATGDGEYFPTGVKHKYTRNL
ncbi:hypothetical protein [Cylindrospermopsis raciborskii]|uniref:hypothetical protein n=1 Tax=Cylindrospermopsis raciborskii TaxID=77022 RepID=UPI003A912543